MAGPARATCTASEPAFSVTVRVDAAMVTPRSSLSMVTVAAEGAPSTPPEVGAESVTVKVSAGSITASLMIGMEMVLLVSPGAKTSTPAGAARPAVPKSLPASAVPLAEVQVTFCARAVEPVRVTVRTTLPAFSATLSAAVASWKVLSSSRIVTVVAGCGPRPAPPVGAESVTVKVSSGSNTVSLSTGMIAPVPTVIVLGVASPAPQARVPLRCAELPSVPKSLPAIALPLEVVQVTLMAEAALPMRCTCIDTTAPPSITE